MLPTLIPTSVVHDPTTSFNLFLIHSNTTPPFCYLVTEIFSNRSIALAVPPLWNKLPQHCDKYLNHPTSSLKTLPLKSPRGSFTTNEKHCSLANPILIYRLP